jgi:hypothetical protein
MQVRLCALGEIVISNRFILSTVAVLAMLSLGGCTPTLTTDGLSQSSMGSLLTVTPSSGSLWPGQVVQLNITSGRAPYTFTIVAGTGNITQAGLYSAPLSVSNSEGTISIEISDAYGSMGYATFYMNPSAIATVPVTYSPNPALTSQSITLTPTGNNGPYSYTLISGSGVLSGNVYLASSVAETAQIQVRDASGVTSMLSIPITSLNVLSYLSVSAQSQHIPGGGGCAANTYQIGAVADADRNSIYGDQIFCGAVNPKGQAAQIITDITVTSGGQHIPGGASCPSGYSLAGQISDCQGGVCSGNQNICTQIQSTSSMTGNPVLDFYVTPSNIHDTTTPGGPACNAGYVNVGVSADCGYGVCSGLQSHCMKR